MAIVLDFRRPRPVLRPAGGIAYGAVSPEKAVSRSAYSDRLVRFIAVAPLLASILVTVVQLTNITGRPARVVFLIVLGLGLLLPNLHHLWALARGESPRFGGWTLAAMTVIFAIGVPLGDASWPLMGVQLLVSAVIVLPRPWSAVAACAVGAAILVVSQIFFRQTNPLWVVVVILDRAGACLALAWFSAALRYLLAAREDLATQAVLRERIRIDADLAETVGAALSTIAARGTAISRLASTESEAAAEQLGILVDGSRQTLAETRRMIREYQRGSLGAELNTAVALLNAAGVRTHLELPGGGLTEAADGKFTASLRATVDRLLHDGSVHSCRLTVIRSSEGLQLLLEAGGSGKVELA